MLRTARRDGRRVDPLSCRWGVEGGFAWMTRSHWLALGYERLAAMLTKLRFVALPLC